ncbi:hypothetical protein [Aeromicrobium sp. UC242_57]|uniref:hypothetical protein n=1 Tax=Aeromicrobium sp. UC242_57 TaxID=3374624 RepID=UPI00379E0C11
MLFATPTLSVGYPQASDAVCNVPWMLGGTVGAKIRTVPVSRAKLLGKKPFTVRVQGNAAWTKDAISGSPADLKLRFTESITLQRVDASGRKLR